jgi:nucleotide-binding universal stress UspA family protein
VTTRPDPPTALTEAVALAEASGAEVGLMGHVADVPASQMEATPREQRSHLRQHQVDFLTDRLTSWVEQVSDRRVPVEIVGGSLPVEVAERVVRDGCDLVLVADDGSGESSAATLRLVRACPCPVWLLRPNFTGRRVLAAVDPDHSSRTNRLILELARSQAELHGGDLHVMHAWELAGLESIERGVPAVMAPDDVARYVSDVESAHRSSFERTLHEAGVFEAASTHFVDGPADRAVQGLTALYRTDLLVIGAGATDQPHLGLGSTAEQILAGARGSVLVVKALGDVPPIER